jgi:hypothetical protein
MKKIILFTLSIIVLFIGCDVESPMDKDLYPQKVYIVGASDIIVDRDLDIGNSPDTISVSIAVSGSCPSNQDVTVTIDENLTAIDNYNTRNLSAEEVQYQKLDDAIYSYPLGQLTIMAGQVYNTYPVYIDPATLHCDSLYMLPLRLGSTTAYELTDEDTIALVRLNLVNQYSGLYYIDGVIKNMSDPTDSLIYKMSRNLTATDDGNTIRMYHYNNEYNGDDANDYRPTHTFKITVEPDSTLSFATWEEFKLLDGGGLYHSALKLYEIWYTFEDNGVEWKTTGYLYKERKTTEEQRILDNWIEDQRNK